MNGEPEPDVRVFPDLAALSRAAADLVLSAALETTALRDRFTLVLSGGSTPRPLYTLLAASPFRERMPWKQVHIFWADERCVPPEHVDSNYRMVSESLLSRIPLPAENVHRMRGEEGPDRAAADYERELADYFGHHLPVFDLVLLGAGADGHTASLFPGSVQMRQTEGAVLPVPLAEPKHSRVTLSLPVLNGAARVLFLASGSAKARMVREVLGGAGNVLPAALVRPRSLVWLVDRGAAAGLNPAPTEAGTTRHG